VSDGDFRRHLRHRKKLEMTGAIGRTRGGWKNRDSEEPGAGRTGAVVKNQGSWKYAGRWKNRDSERKYSPEGFP